MYNNTHSTHGRLLLAEEMLPLTETVYQILLALVGKKLHGYDIMLKIENDTNGEVNLTPGTLYGAIKRLLADKLIEEVPPPPDAKSDRRRRRYYSLTPFGALVVAAEAARLKRAVKQAVTKDIISAGS